MFVCSLRTHTRDQRCADHSAPFENGNIQPTRIEFGRNGFTGRASLKSHDHCTADMTSHIPGVGYLSASTHNMWNHSKPI